MKLLKRILIPSVIVIWVITCFLIDRYSDKAKVVQAFKPDTIIDSVQINSLVINGLSKSKNDEVDLNYFLEFLSEEGDSRKSWLERKEISAWSATILFLYILMLFFTNSEKLENKKFVISILVVFLLFLFSLFIHQQFGDLINGMSIQSALNVWTINAIKANKVPNNFDFTINDKYDLPVSLIEKVDTLQQFIRSHCIVCRLTLPYLYVINKFFNLFRDKNDLFRKHTIKYTTIEIEESILYNILIITSISFLFFFNFKSNKV